MYAYIMFIFNRIKSKMRTKWSWNGFNVYGKAPNSVSLSMISVKVMVYHIFEGPDTNLIRRPIAALWIFE